MSKPYDAILGPGGGLTKEGQLPEWTKTRLDRAIEMQTTEHIIALSAGTVHKPPILDRDEFPLFECSVATEYLVEKGIDSQKILREQASYDTIENAYFTRVIHTHPRQWRKLLIITSEFHIERTQKVFSWVFSLESPRPAYKLEFMSVTDKGFDPQIILPRVEKEKESLKNLLQVKERINTLKQSHIWMFANHGAYSASAKPRRKRGDALKSY
ncbi:MAG: YdcF family protein [Phycisphaerae bacterium]